ncbi:hypothetical protein HN446_02360 [bacterium]|jgi:hypothetical protein|nr:hypothetical protein [bacterium]
MKFKIFVAAIVLFFFFNSQPKQETQRIQNQESSDQKRKYHTNIQRINGEAKPTGFLESVKEHPILWVAGTGVVLYTGALLCTVYYVYDWWKSLGK